jgi:hypothetical protein
MKQEILALQILTSQVKNKKDFNIITNNISFLKRMDNKNLILTKEASSVIRTFNSNNYYKVANNLSKIRIGDIYSQQSLDKVVGNMLKIAFLGDVFRGIGGILGKPFNWIKDKGSYIRINKEVSSFVDKLDNEIDKLKTLQSNGEDYNSFGYQLLVKAKNYTKNKYKEYRALSAKTKNTNLYNVAAPFAHLYNLWNQRVETGEFTPLQALYGLASSIKDLWIEIGKGSSNYSSYSNSNNYSGYSNPTGNKPKDHNLPPDVKEIIGKLPPLFQELVVNASLYHQTPQKALATIEAHYPKLDDNTSSLIYQALLKIYANKTH